MSHREEDHIIKGAPYFKAKAILARHLCGWISGHGAPLEHFLVDAQIIMDEMHEQGIRFHVVGETSNSSDGFVENIVKGGWLK